MLQELYIQQEICKPDAKLQKQKGLRFLGVLHAKLAQIPAAQHTSRASVQKLIHEQRLLQGASPQCGVVFNHVSTFSRCIS